MGPTRFELVTSSLSGTRSNQLSYEPAFRCGDGAFYGGRAGCQRPPTHRAGRRVCPAIEAQPYGTMRPAPPCFQARRPHMDRQKLRRELHAKVDNALDRAMDA